MITKMKFITITGPRDDIDRMVDTYLSDYEIHLENALTELYGTSTLHPYISSNPYTEYLERIDQLLVYFDKDRKHAEETAAKSTKEAIRQFIESTEKNIGSYQQKDVELKAVLEKKQESLELIAPFVNLDYPIEKIVQMDKIRFRFGRFTHINYEKFKKYVYDMSPSIFVECSKDEEYTYGVYFTPVQYLQRVDALYISMNWETIFIPDEYNGTPKEAVQTLQQEIKTINEQIQETQAAIRGMLDPYAPALYGAKKRLEVLSHNFNIRKYAALTRDEFVQKETRYLLRGWMSTKDAQRFFEETQTDSNVEVIVEDDDTPHGGGTPPTKIRNFPLFRPYELFIKMYGVPNYREFDPTWLVALTYSLLFGAMFGDVGQGALLALGGFWLYRKKKADLGGIIALAGVFSVVFGFLYGSVFGFEHLIEPLWLHPMSEMTQLPFIGSLNTVFVAAVVFGIFLILTTLVLNIVSGIKTHHTAEVLFDRNGVAGLLFYGTLILALVLFMTGSRLPAAIILAVLLGVPLLMMALQEPIVARLEHKRLEGSEGPVMFAVQAFFEIFEILLSYFSNTISFVRVGAFAVSHAAMMQVVLMLSGAAEGGDTNWVIVVLGNLFVIGLEGLVVGIQVLRLEFYEIFSHFYKGDGRPFVNNVRYETKARN